MENSELQKQYDQLRDKVKLMLDTQREYFKSGKDINLLRKSKAIEQEVKKMVNPEPLKIAQKELFDMAQ